MKFNGNVEQCATQAHLLSSDALLADHSAGRMRPSSPDLLRNDFQRDRDKILHTKAFRRLSHKTQVFLSPEGDHYRTRLTHTLEVAQIARTISRALSLNEDLTEAIALGHDLGHTPFGHCGEAALSDCLAEVYPAEQVGKDDPRRRFRHYEQSLRVVDVIEHEGRGLNLTFEVRDGIAHHSGAVKPKTLEGLVVSTADRIAYVNHDIDDAIRAGILVQEDLPAHALMRLGQTHSARIQTLVEDMVAHSLETGAVGMSDEVWQAMDELRTFLFANVYHCPAVSAEVVKAEHIVKELFWYFLAHPEDISAEYLALSPDDVPRAVTDFIAGMTDRYAIRLYTQLFIPSAFDSILS